MKLLLHMRRKAAALGVRASVVGAIGLLVVAVAGPLSAQEGGIDFVVEPAPGSQVAEGGGYFLIPTEPSIKVVQSLALRNDSGRRLALRLAGVDATTGPYGGVSYGLEDDPATRMGGWISLERNSVTLGAGESRIVDFEVEVPPDADSGEHLAGISVFSPASEDETEEAEEGEAGAAIHVQTRRVIAVQVSLPGSSRPELAISGIEPAARPDGLYLEIAIENVGHGLTKGTGEVAIPSEGFQQAFDVDTFVPGTGIGYPVRWIDSAPEGEYAARVEIEYEGGVASWEGTFTVGPGVLEDLAERGVEVPGSSIPVWLWPAAGAAVLAVAAAVLVAVRRRTAPALPVRRPGTATTSTPVRRVPPPPPTRESFRGPPPPPPR